MHIYCWPVVILWFTSHWCLVLFNVTTCRLSNLIFQWKMSSTCLEKTKTQLMKATMMIKAQVTSMDITQMMRWTTCYSQNLDYNLLVRKRAKIIDIFFCLLVKSLPPVSEDIQDDVMAAYHFKIIFQVIFNNEDCSCVNCCIKLAKNQLAKPAGFEWL